MYDRRTNRIELFRGGSHGQEETVSDSGDADDPRFREILGDYLYNHLMEEIELLEIAGDELDMERNNFV